MFIGKFSCLIGRNALMLQATPSQRSNTRSLAVAHPPTASLFQRFVLLVALISIALPRYRGLAS